MSDVVTGEAVPLQLRLAKLPSRALALAIDAAAYVVCGVAIYGLAGAVVPTLDQALATALGLAATITLLVAVPATIETLTRGKSLGKFALGLRVVRDDGGPIRGRHALVRALSGVFADFVITLGVGAIFCSILNERGKRIGDVLAGTVVLRERIPRLPGMPDVPPELSSWAEALELSGLPNELALSARNYLTRAPQLSPQIRASLGEQLANQVAAVVSPPPPPGTPAWAYLAAVLGERGRRETLRMSAQAASPTTSTPAPAQQPSLPPLPPAESGQPARNPGGFVPPE